LEVPKGTTELANATYVSVSVKLLQGKLGGSFIREKPREWKGMRHLIVPMLRIQ